MIKAKRFSILLIGFFLCCFQSLAQSFVPATATATLTGMFVTGVTVNNGGSGYIFPPLVSFIGGGGNSAGAYSVISNGSITQIVVTNAGGAYTSVPEVVIAQPGNYSFCSTGAYLEVPDSPSLDSTTNALTVECWFNRSAGQSDWNSVVSRETGGFDLTGYDLTFSGNLAWGIILSSPEGPGSTPTGNTTPSYPAWHHYAVEFDQTNYQVWLDGALIYHTNFPAQIVISPYYLSIGSQYFGERPFAGYIDEVRISNVARYQSPFSPQIRFATDTNTVALYHFDEGTGTVAHDSSGYGNDGTITGSTAWSTNVPVIPSVVVNVRKAVYLNLSGLSIGTNYQVQVASNLYGGTWYNFGAPFTATATTMDYTNYWNVSDGNELFFRLSY